MTTTSDSGVGSLREAIALANVLTDSDTILFDETVFNSPQTITLASTLPPLDSVSITGPAAGVTIVRARELSSFVFRVISRANVSFDRLTISSAYYGIQSLGKITVNNCTFSGCRTGIYNDNLDGRSVVANVNNCTFSGNDFAGFTNREFATLANCTFTGNSVGILNDIGSLTVQNTISSGNRVNNAAEPIINGGNNYFGGDAKLGPLQDNGGPTPTHLPAPDSPVIDAGDTTSTTDQRGAARPQGTQDDIGAVEYSPPPTGPNFVVTTTEDLHDGDYSANDISLREAILFANADPDASTITFDVTGAINLVAPLPALSTNVEIEGPGANFLTVSGNSSFDNLVVEAGALVSISGLTISGGYKGVYNAGSVTIANCALSNNVEEGFDNAGNATLTNCYIFDNGEDGVDNGATLTITNSTIANNGDEGVDSSSIVTLNNCTITGNAGWEVRSDGVGTMTNCTIVNNDGSGVNNSETLTIRNSLIVGSEGNNISGYPLEAGSGNNIIGGTTADAGLDPAGLKDNGGPTKTIALIAGSPAIDAAANDAPETDQRGIAREGAPDIGAFEYQTPPNTPPTIADIAIATDEDSAFVFAETTFDDGFSDNETQELAAIKVVSLPTSGVLTLEGVAVEEDDVIARADLTKLAYTPDENFNGDDEFDYNASDGALFAEADATVKITVTPLNDPPVIGDDKTIAGNEGELITFFADGMDVDSGDVLIYSLIGAPEGATINSSTGEFRWIPTEAQGPGTYTFQIKVTDGTASAFQSVTIQVREVNSPPSLDLGGNRTVTGGVPFSFGITASDSDIPQQGLGVYPIAPTPNWVGLTNGPTIYGTAPVSNAPYTVTIAIRAGDSFGANTDKSIQLTVLPVPKTVTWTVTPTFNASEGTITYRLKNNTSAAITGVYVSGHFRVQPISVSSNIGTTSWNNQGNGYYGVYWHGFNVAPGQEKNLTVKVARPATGVRVANGLYAAFGPDSQATLLAPKVIAP